MFIFLRTKLGRDVALLLTPMTKGVLIC